MSKTLLIPIDFKVESLNTLKLALDEHRFDEVKVLLLYARYLSDSITELLFYEPSNVIQQAITPQFSDALNIIRNSYESTVRSIKIEVFHGVNTIAASNFLRAKNIDLIYVPKIYRLKTKGEAFDPIPILRRCNAPIIELNWDNRQSNSSGDELSHLLI